MNQRKLSSELVPGFEFDLCRVSNESMQGITFICARTQRNRWKESNESLQGFKIILCRGFNVSMQGIKLILSWIHMNLFRDSNESMRGITGIRQDSNLICAGTQINWYMVSKL